MRSRDFGEATGKLSVKVSEIDTRCAGFGSHDDIALHRKHIFISSCEHTKSTLHTITRYSVTNSLADGKSHTSHDIRRCLNITGIVMHHKVHDDIRIRHLEATLQHCDEVTMAFQPLHSPSSPTAIRRTERVRMRTRKPCFIERRRLLGWNVLFIVMLPVFAMLMHGSHESSSITVL